MVACSNYCTQEGLHFPVAPSRVTGANYCTQDGPRQAHHATRLMPSITLPTAFSQLRTLPRHTDECPPQVHSGYMTGQRTTTVRGRNPQRTTIGTGVLTECLWLGVNGGCYCVSIGMTMAL
jgi:hypothetical protein